jgi:hypothetical protein
MATKDRSAGKFPLFGEVLRTRDPATIQKEIFARLEHERLDRIASTQISAEQDHQALESAIADLSDRVPPERLRRLSGLSALLAEQAAQADAAATAVKNPPSITAGGWLAMGRVREFDGTPAKGGQINFEGGGDSVSRLLKPIKIGVDGQASVAFDAATVAKILRGGALQVVITAQVDDRIVQDVAPAQIAADSVHQFDLVLPPPTDSAATPKSFRPAPARRKK